MLPAIQHKGPRARRRAHGAALALSVSCALGCEAPGPRVYTAQAYLAEADCLEPYAPLGLVEAEALPSTCAPVCLRAGEQLYVSTVCPPYPLETTREARRRGSECDAALDAFEAERGCESIDAGGRAP